MITIRKSEDRGVNKFSWLDSRHTFSFGSYDDPEHVHFGALRVINEDWVAGGGGFDTHPHRNMEILTWVLEGALAHKDSLGTGSQIKPGDIQRMTAGKGILHSEHNPNPDQTVHLLQIWIIPEQTGLDPSYEEKNFNEQRANGGLTLLASRDGRDGSVTVHQDVMLYVLDLKDGQTFDYALGDTRIAWAQMARGGAIINGETLKQGDAAGIREETMITFKAQGDTEILLFDLHHL